jgi:ABC-2 type transport system ATP-binding protein
MELRIENLFQEYNKGKPAIDSLTLSLTDGITGLLGPNGAGKSSLMKILATIQKPNQGKVFLNGKNILKSPQHLRNILGYLPQYFGVYENLTGTEFLSYLAGLKGMQVSIANKRIDNLLQQLNLADVANVPLKQYSGGMRQRIGIAQAVINEPDVLIVDEPTVGLDPDERANFRDMLVEMSANRIILLSTHIVSDVESIADKIAIMQKGKLLAHASVEGILQKVENKVWACRLSHDDLVNYKKNFLMSKFVRKGCEIHATIIADKPPHSSATLQTARLEDAYIAVTSLARISNNSATQKAFT